MGMMKQWLDKFEDRLRQLGWLEKTINRLDLEEISGYLVEHDDNPELAADAYNAETERRARHFNTNGRAGHFDLAV